MEPTTLLQEIEELHPDIVQQVKLARVTKAQQAVDSAQQAVDAATQHLEMQHILLQQRQTELNQPESPVVG